MVLMRKITLFLVVVMCMSFALHTSDWSRIKDSFATGNAQQLSEFFAPTVTLSLPDHKGNFSSRQTRSMMDDFFKQYPPASFSVRSSAPKGEDATFYLGVYTTKKGQQFSTYLLVQHKGGKFIITQITLDRN
jgi:hypothetical protein